MEVAVPPIAEARSATVAVVVPAYRPSGVLVDIVRAAQEELRKQDISAAIVVVDDGSPTAEFGQLFAMLRALPGVEVLRHAVNLGKGMALRTGINHALVELPSLLGVITADADGQHLPVDVGRVAAALVDHPRELILGTRVFDNATPLRSRFGNVVTRWIFHVFTRRDLRDTQTGLRGLPRAVAERVLRIQDAGYELELASLVQEARRGTVIRQLPIATVYEPGNPTSHFDPLRDSLRIYFVFLRYSVVALSAAVLDYLLFFAIYGLTGALLLSVVTGRILVGWLYFLAVRSRVFRVDDGNIARQAVLFVLVVVLSALATYGLLTVLLLVFRLPLPVAKLLADFGLFLANFALLRLFVFPRDN